VYGSNPQFKIGSYSLKVSSQIGADHLLAYITEKQMHSSKVN